MDSVRLSLCNVRKLILLSVLLASGKACFTTLEDAEGELAPPLYPQVDLVNLDCTWILRAEEGKVIEITFEEVILDATIDQAGNCLDRITVYDGPRQIIPPFCDDGPPWPRFPIRLISTTDTMVINLVKQREASRGFLAKYKHVSPRQELLAVINVDNPAIALFDRLSSLSSSKEIHLLHSSSPSALSFDPISEIFYFTDIQKRAIGRASLRNSTVSFIIEENVDTPLGIAVAYLTGLLYWTDAGRHDVSVSRLDGTFRKTLMTSSPDCWTPKGIVLSRDNQDIFWTCKGRIEKAKADGSERDPTFVIDNVVEPSALAIDTDGTFIYWVDTGAGKIDRVRVDGLYREQMDQSPNSFLTQLHSLVLDEFAYFFTHTSDQKVYIIERGTEEIELRFLELDPPETFGGLYYYNSDMAIQAQHACAINNGGCEGLCFPDRDDVKCVDGENPLYFKN
ncbi:Low-density lipoprotein receptor-related protein 6 [Holothuria leucospilota]|uniref:Low-density lipoprotein receptor-related protein 6 n=1 Tax=Holothuria leucospilota TaxID=206669 RepID=A0A9Q1CCZ7_HOLLE|nr:Low-density lipoprotein receptor-related protein 6 [Holothuria leucospilota]